MAEISRAMVATTGADLANVETLAAPFEITVIALESLRQGAVQTDEDDRPVCVEREGDLLGVVSASAEGAEAIAGHRDLLSLLAGSADVAHFRIDRDGAAAFGPWLFGRMAELASSYIADAAQLRRSNAVLRREHDGMLERFTFLERDYMRAAPPRISKLDYPAADVGLPAQRLVQRLPVSPLGIGMVDLKVEDASPQAKGSLHVELFAQGRPDALQRWSLGAAQLTPGWIGLKAERAVAFAAMETRLEVRWEGEPEQAPRLGLSRPTPLEEYAVTPAGAPGPPRPLALRVWSFTPGARLPAAGLAADEAAESQAEDAPIHFGLSVKELGRSELLSPLGLNLGFNLVAFRPDTGDILVHPNAAQPTVAVIRDVPIGRAKAVRAIVRVDHKQARPVEFGLVLARSRPIHTGAAGLIRSWTRVDHSVFAEAPGHVEEGPGPYDLLLATRMAEGADPDLAWALFKKIEVVA